MAAERTPKKEKEAGTLNLRSLKKIITIMNRAKITELDIEQDGLKIHLRKGPAMGELVATAVAAPAPAMNPAAMTMPVMSLPTAPAPSSPAPVPAEDDANLFTMTSPMVGTFYRSPSPESNPYVEVGSSVDENTVVCIVEAMKLMNEIKAEVKGVIKKILVENAQAVEYGQPLFLVERRL